MTTASNWGGDNVCLYVPGTSNGYAGSFTGQNQPTAPFNGNVLAFPDTNIGCEGGYCSRQSGLPALTTNPASPSPSPSASATATDSTPTASPTDTSTPSPSASPTGS